MENCGTDLVEMYNTILTGDRLTIATNHIGQIIDVIECLHQNWFVHFDIKPENVVLHENTIKLIDAGSLTYVNVYNNIVYVRGTDFYMAPELQGKTKIANSVGLLSTDIYSLGVLFLLMNLPLGRVRNKLFKNMNQYKFSDNIDDSEDRIIIQNWLESVFGETIKFEHFFGEPDERITIQDLKSKYKTKQKQTLDQTTPSGGRSICKTNKRRSNKRRLDKRKRQRKSKSKSKSKSRHNK